MDNEAGSSNLNSTFTKGDAPAVSNACKNVESYDITPARHELPPEPLHNPENYDINDIRSDEDTDDEDAPKKEVPAWAEGDPNVVRYKLQELGSTIEQMVLSAW